MDSVSKKRRQEENKVDLTSSAYSEKTLLMSSGNKPASLLENEIELDGPSNDISSTPDEGMNAFMSFQAKVVSLLGELADTLEDVRVKHDTARKEATQLQETAQRLHDRAHACIKATRTHAVNALKSLVWEDSDTPADQEETDTMLETSMHI